MTSRRDFLRRTTALTGAGVVLGYGASVLPAVAPSLFLQAASAAPSTTTAGTLTVEMDPEVRGLGSIDKPIKRNQRQQTSRFGFLFPDLPPAPLVPDSALSALADTMRDRAAGSPLGDNLFYNAAGQLTDAMPAGLTYIGQFVDHDISLDRTPLAEATADPNAVQNFRKPALNLDSVYDGGVMRNERFYLPVNQFGVLDYPRDPRSGFADIGDFRNDENLLLQPIQLAFMRFHNSLLDQGLARNFEHARRLTRWHYQWIVVKEFLPAVIGQPMIDELIKFTPGQNPVVKTKYYKPSSPPRMLPVEFSVACYRLHTLVRNNYNPTRVLRIGIFNSVPLNLVGGRPVPPELVMEPDLFFRTSTSPPFDPPNTSAAIGSFNVNRRYDGSISPQLYNLPAFALPNSPEFNNLPVRNLIRASRLELPSGQAVAARVGVQPLSNVQLNVNAANIAGGTHGLLDPVWNGQAPLWFYMNKEAELMTEGRRLGPMGARIVGEVIAGLLGADPTSFMNKGGKRDDDEGNAEPFVPKPPIALVRGQFMFADLLRFIGSAA